MSHNSAIRTLFADGRRSLVTAVARRRSYIRTIHELSICTDRDLADMGIARSDIRRLARENSAMIT